MARPQYPLLVALFIMIFGGAAPLCAQQVAVRRFDVSNGLAHGRVTSILQDRPGYLWFGTWEGLSRFDGDAFVTYGADEGLDPPVIFDLAEDPHGRIWVALWGGGVARLRDEGGIPPGRRFVRYAVADSRESNQVYRLFFSGDDLWCLTSDGAYHAEAGGDTLRFRRVQMEGRAEDGCSTADGRVWLGVSGRLAEFRDGVIAVTPSFGGDSTEAFVAMRPDPAGGILVARSHSVARYVPPADKDGAGIWAGIPVRLPPAQEIRCIAADSSGVMWIGTRHGLVRFGDDGQKTLSAREGLPDDFVRALAADSDGNLWIATFASGVGRYSGDRLVTIPHDTSIPDVNVTRMFEGRDGRLYGTTGAGGVLEIDERGLRLIPGSNRAPFDNLNYRLVQDARGDWWAGTDDGLYRCDGPELQFQHYRRFTRRDGISEKLVLGLWCDREADTLWVGSDDLNLYRVVLDDRDRPRFEAISLRSLPDFMSAARQILRDRHGTLWITGFSGIARLIGERLVPVAASPGLPETQARCVFEDSRGWVWLGLRHRGVSFTRDPDAREPAFANLSTRDGLSSGTVWWVAEDDDGRIYLAGGRGFDRFDPATWRIHSFTTADGLAGNEVNHCLRDTEGFIWLATTGGVSRFDPRVPVRTPKLPPPYIRRVQVAGEDLPLPERGVREVPSFTVPAAHNSMMIEYAAPSYSPDAQLRYEARLTRGKHVTTLPGDQRMVNLARLEPGRYRFTVTTVDAAGHRYPVPAVVSFDILPPVWRRSWFLGIVLIAVVATVVGVARYRVTRLLELERLRRQIAVDLHDDIGSGLAEIAILSEVARQGTSPEASAMLGHSAGLARSMRDAMNDIVWSVDPRQDRLLDLVRRMRQVTYSLLEVNGVEVEFTAPGDEELRGIGLGPDRRRHVLLIFKEAVANIARHSGAGHARILLALGRGRLDLEIDDDGSGLDPTAESGGNGLRSMRSRAEELGARFDLRSTPGRGTTLAISVPLKRPGRHRRPR